jgi:hypothetical protein
MSSANGNGRPYRQWKVKITIDLGQYLVLSHALNTGWLFALFFRTFKNDENHWRRGLRIPVPPTLRNRRWWGTRFNVFSMSFVTRSGGSKGCPLSPFLFNFVTDYIISKAQGSTANHGFTVPPNLRVRDLDYADNVICLFDFISEAQEVPDSLKRSADGYDMQFTPPVSSFATRLDRCGCNSRYCRPASWNSEWIHSRSQLHKHWH